MSSIFKFTLPGLLAIGLMTSCSSAEKPKSEEPSVSVSTYSPSAENNHSLFVSGMVSSKQTAFVSTRMMGYIHRIYVKQGDHVAKGQLLVSINSEDLKAKRAQIQAMIVEAEAAARNANKDYERYKNLHAQKSVSDKELENMQLNQTSVNAKLQMARQSLKEVNSMFNYTDIRAPFAGTVTQKMMDEGSTASPGMPILVIEQTGDLNINASVPEANISHLKVGMPVQIDIKSQDLQFVGHISEISPSAETTGGQYGVKIRLPQEVKSRLKAGMYAGIQIAMPTSTQPTEGVWVETSSVIRRDQLTGVYVATADNKAVLRWIRLGKVRNGRIEVLSGLDASAKVIRSAGVKLYNGRSIKITN